jgi:hypothetical protein
MVGVRGACLSLIPASYSSECISPPPNKGFLIVPQPPLSMRNQEKISQDLPFFPLPFFLFEGIPSTVLVFILLGGIFLHSITTFSPFVVFYLTMECNFDNIYNKITREV